MVNGLRVCAQGGYALIRPYYTSTLITPTVSIPDAELLFTGDFKREGPDLVLTGHDGHHHVIPGYFSGQKHAALVAPNGAALPPISSNFSPARPPRTIRAGAATTPPAIGKVEKVVGNVTVMRNGVAVALNVGDAVYKSDVITTGADSSYGVSFPDGTALDLVANTRMALNDYSTIRTEPQRRAVQPGPRHLLLRRRQGRPYRRHEDRHAGGDDGHPRHHRLVQEQSPPSPPMSATSASRSRWSPIRAPQSAQYELVDQFGNVVASVGVTGQVDLR